MSKSDKSGILHLQLATII